MVLENYVAVICGGSGRVGSVIAKTLANEGYRVIIQYRQNETAANKIIDDIHAAGGKATALQADLTDQTAVQNFIAQINDEMQGIHVFVNAVHGQFDPKPVAEMTWQDWDIHLAALKSHFLVCKEIIPVMRAQKYGRIIFISGGLSRRYFSGCSAYTTIKAGLNGFCKTLALEEGRHGITVNIVAPGKVVTLDERDSTDNPAAWAELNKQSLSKSPLGRDANALDVAFAVRYFASPEASCITGQTLFITGGEIMP